MMIINWMVLIIMTIKGRKVWRYQRSRKSKKDWQYNGQKKISRKDKQLLTKDYTEN
jgi:hypothetical protein